MLHCAKISIQKTRKTIVIGPSNRFANSQLRTGGWAEEVACHVAAGVKRKSCPSYYDVFKWIHQKIQVMPLPLPDVKLPLRFAAFLGFLAIKSVINNFRVGNCETMNMLVIEQMVEGICKQPESFGQVALDYVAADFNKHFFVMVNAVESKFPDFLDVKSCGEQAFVIDAYNNIICPVTEMDRQQRHYFGGYRRYNRVFRLNFPEDRNMVINIARHFNQFIVPNLESSLCLIYPNIPWLVEKSNLADLSLTCKEDADKAFTLG